LVITFAFKNLRKWHFDFSIVGTAVLAVAVVAFNILDVFDATFAIMFAVLALLIVKTDLEHFEIPDMANFGIFMLGTLWIARSSFYLGEEVLQGFARAFVAAIFLYAVKRVYRLVRKIEGLGWGDVKLAAAGAVWLSWQQMPAALLLAAIAGVLLAIGQFLRVRESPSMKSAIPFGAVLAPSTWLVWFAGVAGLL
jgi:leader peptidase (prepilin peptidase)/N-methyltransferase